MKKDKLTTSAPLTPLNGPALIGSLVGSSLRGVTTTENVPVVPLRRKRILFVGWGRTGKDEGAQYCEAHLGLRYGGSTSWAAKEDIAKAMGVHPMTAWEQRHNNRQFWKDHCDWLRRDDPCLLIRRALATGDVIAGIRDRVELFAVMNERLFDVVYWVNRPDAPEDFTVTFTQEDVVSLGGRVLENNGTLREYHRLVLKEILETLGEPLRLSSYALELANEL